MKQLQRGNLYNYRFTFCIIIIPLVIIMVAHYHAGNKITHGAMGDQPAAGISPDLTNLLLKI